MTNEKKKKKKKLLAFLYPEAAFSRAWAATVAEKLLKIGGKEN